MLEVAVLVFLSARKGKVNSEFRQGKGLKSIRYLLIYLEKLSSKFPTTSQPSPLPKSHSQSLTHQPQTASVTKLQVLATLRATTNLLQPPQIHQLAKAATSMHPTPNLLEFLIKQGFATTE